MASNIVRLYGQSLLHAPRRYFYLIYLLIGLSAVVILSPASINLWWHSAHGNKVRLLRAEFTLPLAWSAPNASALAPNGMTLERRGWFAFRASAINTLTLWAPNHALGYGIADAVQTMTQRGLTASQQVKLVHGHQYRCVSSPSRREWFSAFHFAPQIDAYCEETGTGWRLMYSGSPEILDEGLEISASRLERPASGSSL